MNHDEAWPLLDAYLTGAIDTDRRRSLTVHIAECTQCHVLLAEKSRVGRALRERLREIPIPPGLVDRIRANVVRAHRTRAPQVARRPIQSTMLFPAAALLALLVVSVWWVARATVDRPGPTLDLVGELAGAHSTFAHDESRLEVTGEPSAITSWFAGKIPFSVTTPEVPGYELEGARLVTIDGQTAAQLVYENEEARRYVSLITFEVPARELAGLASSNGFASGTTDEIAAVIWSEGDLRHALVTETSPSEASKLAATVADPP